MFDMRGMRRIQDISCVCRDPHMLCEIYGSGVGVVILRKQLLRGFHDYKAGDAKKELGCEN